MRKTYVRPLALLWGPDARAAVAEGRAGWIAGGWVAHAQAELIERQGRDITRRVLAYRDLAHAVDPALIARMASPRTPLDGLSLDRPRLMGIVNVTPDSFSDGGLHADPAAGAAHGLTLAPEGAHILDVGGESTRPGALDVPLEDELARVLPVVEALTRAGQRVSIDTRKAPVMAAAIEKGARIINDVSALSHDPDSLGTAARLGCPVVLMHTQGTPQTMQLNPIYEDVALDVYDHLEARIQACQDQGFGRHLLLADPGFGFGKTSLHNLELLQQLALFHGLGVPLVVGLSRKGFMRSLTDEPLPAERVFGSVGGAVQAVLNGAQIMRVHDVRATRQALAVAMAAVDPSTGGF